MGQYAIGAMNLREIDPSQGGSGFPPLAIGDGQLVRIVASNVVEVKNDQGGAYLQLVLEVLEGPNPGSFGAHNLGLWSTNEQAQDIAFKSLSALGHALGILDLPGINDEAEDNAVPAFHGKPFQINVAAQIDKSTGQPDARGFTRVTKILNANGEVPTAQNAGAGASAGGASWKATPAAAQPVEAPAEPAAAPATASWKKPGAAATPAASQPAASNVPAWKRGK